MEGSRDQPESEKRRSVLQFTALAGGLGVFPSGVSAEPGNRRPETDEVVLGDFEDGLDGWRTNGGNELERVSEDEFPAAVVSGQHGLVVEVNGDMHPMIENKKRVKQSDLLNHPYLGMHVMALAEGTDSDLVFTFRLHHTANDSGNGKGGNGSSRGTGSNGNKSSGSKDVQVEESEPKEVLQLRPRTVQWDMTDLSDEVLRTAKRLEIVWYLEDHEPDGGHRGNSKGDFDYQGLVAFDDIRLSETAPVSEAKKKQQKRMALHRKHGMIVTRNFEERREGFERGTLIYADGTEVPYEYESLDGTGYRYTIDGERFEVDGGGDDE